MVLLWGGLTGVVQGAESPSSITSCTEPCSYSQGAQSDPAPAFTLTRNLVLIQPPLLPPQPPAQLC